MDGFEAWMRHLFERPEEEDDEWLNSFAARDTPEAQAERVRRLCANAGELLSGYSDDQVADGITDVIQDELYVFQTKLPTVAKTRGLRSLVTLFAEVFAPRIGDVHPDHGPKLDGVCFMFFDSAPLRLGDDTVLDVLEAISDLDSVACQRSALHGLGHAHHSAPQEARKIVDRWLERHPRAPQELRDYAKQAREGLVM